MVTSPSEVLCLPSPSRRDPMILYWTWQPWTGLRWQPMKVPNWLMICEVCYCSQGQWFQPARLESFCGNWKRMRCSTERSESLIAEPHRMTPLFEHNWMVKRTWKRSSYPRLEKWWKQLWSLHPYQSSLPQEDPFWPPWPPEMYKCFSKPGGLVVGSLLLHRQGWKRSWWTSQFKTPAWCLFWSVSSS